MRTMTKPRNHQGKGQNDSEPLGSLTSKAFVKIPLACVRLHNALVVQTMQRRI